MAEQISAEEGALKAGADAVRDTKQALDSRLASIRGEIDSLQGAWKGGAAGAFRNLMQKWDEETKRVNNILDTLERNIRTTEDDQARTEQEHMERASKYANRM